MRRIIVVILLASVLLTSCVTHTRVTFHTEPEGADIYVQNQPKGTTPVSTLVTNAIWEDPQVALSLEGYEGRTVTLQKEVKIINLALGVIGWFPALFWVYGPKDTQRIVLYPSEGSDVARESTEVEEQPEPEQAPEPAEPAESNEVRRQTTMAIGRALDDGEEVRLSLVFRTGEGTEEGKAGLSADTVTARLLERYGQRENFNLVDRSETEEILEEYEFQMSGMVDEEQLNEIGQLSGATHLLIVEYTRNEQSSVLTVEDRRRLLRVQSGTAAAADATVFTFIWDSNSVSYNMVSATHNGRPVRVENGRMYPVE